MIMFSNNLCISSCTNEVLITLCISDNKSIHHFLTARTSYQNIGTVRTWTRIPVNLNLPLQAFVISKTKTDFIIYCMAPQKLVSHPISCIKNVIMLFKLPSFMFLIASGFLSAIRFIIFNLLCSHDYLFPAVRWLA